MFETEATTVFFKFIFWPNRWLVYLVSLLCFTSCIVAPLTLRLLRHLAFALDKSLDLCVRCKSFDAIVIYVFCRYDLFAKSSVSYSLCVF